MALTKGVPFSSQVAAIQPPSLRQITLRVNAVGGINLGQGVCQLPVPPEVLEAAERAMREGNNRYTSPYGLINLRKAIARKLKAHNGIEVDPETEILVTAGTTGAFEGVCASLLDPGDAVVCFSPYYPYYHNGFKRFKADIRYVDLVQPGWTIDWDQLSDRITPEVKFLLLISPSNPTGKVFSRHELERICALCRDRDVLLVTDEIYEYMTYDRHRHVSAASLPDMAERTITMGGYSKTFAITGWRIGYLTAPKYLLDRMVGLFDNIYVCAPAPLQQGVAEAIDTLPEEFYSSLRTMYERKRSIICEALENLGLTVMRPQGSYYAMAEFSRLFPTLDANGFVERMIERTRVGAVPSDDFVLDASQHRWARFCFALPDEELERAAEMLKGLI